MIKYKLGKNFQGELECIVDKENNRAIPLDENNTYYQEYLEWVAEGNTPEEAE